MEGQEFAQPQAPDNKMSVQEAEAVFALWNQIQEQQGPYSSRPTVRDMAEALSIPESEVAILLQKVRSQAPPVVAPQQVKRKGLPPIAIAAMAVAGIAIISGSVFAGMLLGSEMSRTAPGFPTVAPMPPMAADTVAPASMETPATAIRNTIPTDTTISIGDYVLEGRNEVMIEPDILEERIADGLLQILPLIHPMPDVSYSVSDSELEAVRDGIANQKPVKGLLAFEEIVVKTKKESFTTKIPISLVDNDSINETVMAAQRRAVRLAANHASISKNSLLAPK